MTYNNHAPFPVETNGPAHIIMTLNIAKAMNVPPNLDHIARYAEKTRQYIIELGKGNLPAWHELSLPSPLRQEVLEFFRRLHASNDGDIDATLARIAEIITAN